MAGGSFILLASVALLGGAWWCVVRGGGALVALLGGAWWCVVRGGGGGAPLVVHGGAPHGAPSVVRGGAPMVVHPC